MTLDLLTMYELWEDYRWMRQLDVWWIISGHVHQWILEEPWNPKITEKMYNKTKTQYTITYKKQPFYDFYFDVELLNFQYDKVYLTNSDFVVIIMITIHVHETNLARKMLLFTCRGTRQLPVTNCRSLARFSSSNESTIAQNHFTTLLSGVQCFNLVFSFQSSISILPNPLTMSCK